MSCEVLIIEPLADLRGFLWQAAHRLQIFSNVRAVPNLETAIALMSSRGDFDVVLISSNLGQEKVSEFVKQAKGTDSGSESAYITVLSSTEQNRDYVAAQVLEGGDGFLFAPFSISSMNDVADIARAMRLNKVEKRCKVALTLYLKEAREAVDKLALAKSLGQDLAPLKEKLRQIMKPVQARKEIFLPVLGKVAAEVFERALPKPKIDYTGASTILRERMKRKLLKADKD